MLSTLDLLITKTFNEETKEPIVDFTPTKEGQLQVLYANEAVKQRAILSSFVQRGSIPQLPNVGIEWVEFLSELRSPAEINSQIFDAMHNHANTYDYIPKYETSNNELTVTIEENK